MIALSALFGKWLTIDATAIAFSRAAIAVGVLVLFIKLFSKTSLVVGKKNLVYLALTGALLAGHWVSFFGSIQLTTVAIGLVTFATFPLFVSLFEPLLFGEKLHKRSIVQALITLLGLYLLVPIERVDQSMMLGIGIGLLSAFIYACFAIANRKLVKRVAVTKVALYQNLFAALTLLPLMALHAPTFTEQDIWLIIALGVICTAMANSLFNYALRGIDAKSVSIVVSLEPIYGIIAAYFLLDERLSLMMIIGGGLVLVANAWVVMEKGK